jgi:hypothetical protein
MDARHTKTVDLQQRSSASVLIERCDEKLQQEDETVVLQQK